MSQKGILNGSLERLDRSRRGHSSTITRLCNELHESLKDFSNVVKIGNAIVLVVDNRDPVFGDPNNRIVLVVTNKLIYLSDRAAQNSRIEAYSGEMEQFRVGSAAFCNIQVSHTYIHTYIHITFIYTR